MWLPILEITRSRRHHTTPGVFRTLVAEPVPCAAAPLLCGNHVRVFWALRRCDAGAAEFEAPAAKHLPRRQGKRITVTPHTRRHQLLSHRDSATTVTREFIQRMRWNLGGFGAEGVEGGRPENGYGGGGLGVGEHGSLLRLSISPGLAWRRQPGRARSCSHSLTVQPPPDLCTQPHGERDRKDSRTSSTDAHTGSSVARQAGCAASPFASVDVRGGNSEGWLRTLLLSTLRGEPTAVFQEWQPLQRSAHVRY